MMSIGIRKSVALSGVPNEFLPESDLPVLLKFAELGRD